MAMRYGRMQVAKKKADVWIYLVKATPTLVFHTYYLNGEPVDGLHVVEEVLAKASPSPAFKLAKTPTEILALATYYFMRKDLAKSYEMTLMPLHEFVLNSMCSRKKPSKIVSLRVRSAQRETPRMMQELRNCSAQPL